MRFFSILFALLMFCQKGYTANGDSQWLDRCTVDKSVEHVSSTPPVPNYNHPEILRVAGVLSQISPASFYMYSEIENVYGLCKGRYRGYSLGAKQKAYNHCNRLEKPYTQMPMEITIPAHNFLTILCGEYRDNVPMFLSKLNLYSNMWVAKEDSQNYDPLKSPWQQITGPGYFKLVSISENLRRLYEHYDMEENQFGVKSSVPALTQCHYRYLLAEYIVSDREIPFVWDEKIDRATLAAFKKGYSHFEKQCPDYEKEIYNEFRGDGNAKPHTLESNAMIWNARIYGRNCKDTRRASGRSLIDHKDCENYYTRPFQSRMSQTKAGLLRLLFYPRAYDETMKNYNRDLVFITEDLTGDGVAEMVVVDGEASPISLIRDNIGRLKDEMSYYIDEIEYTKIELDDILEQLKNPLLTDQEKEILETMKANVEGRLNNYKLAIKTYRSQLKLLPLIVQLAVVNSGKKILPPQHFDKLSQRLIEKLTSKIEVLKPKKYYSDVVEIIFNQASGGATLVTELIQGWDPAYMQETNLGVKKIFRSPQEVWDRLATLFDRHTDWYFIDLLLITKGVYLPAYSPWVASSYYIHSSDHFTIPGYAMNLPNDGHRHWMYIQNIKKDKWVRATDIFEKWDQLDILNSWFDESTISRGELASSENGWDRPFATVPEEHGQLIWLFNAGEFVR